MYWQIRDKKERAKAKAEFEAAATPIVQGGPRPGEITTSVAAITSRGVLYAFADHGGPVLARMLALSNCPPLPPGLPIEVSLRSIRVGPVTFHRGVAAFFTRITFEALQRELARRQDATASGTPTAP